MELGAVVPKADEQDPCGIELEENLSQMRFDTDQVSLGLFHDPLIPSAEFHSRSHLIRVELRFCLCYFFLQLRGNSGIWNLVEQLEKGLISVLKKALPTYLF